MHRRYLRDAFVREAEAAGLTAAGVTAKLTAVLEGAELPFMVPECAFGSTQGDLNGDGIVDGVDLTLLLGGWGTAGPGDLNGDGMVDGADLAILLALWAP